MGRTDDDLGIGRVLDEVLDGRVQREVHLFRVVHHGGHDAAVELHHDRVPLAVGDIA